jgi:hypothetical protein
MRIIAFIATLSLSVLFATSGCAAVQEDHKAHHPATSNPTQKSNENTVPPAQSDANESMDSQMKSMRAIHEKMMRATSTDERKKLMAEHSKAMQDGMAMMKNMPMMDEHSGHSDMNAMHDMGAMKCDMKDEMACCKKDGSKLNSKDAMKCDMKEGMKCCMAGDMKGDMKCDMKDGMTANAPAKHQMMEKRMEMMETMMQMMMDRLINEDYDEHQASVKK